MVSDDSRKEVRKEKVVSGKEGEALTNPEVLLESGEKSEMAGNPNVDELEHETGSVFSGGDFQSIGQNSGSPKRIIFILIVVIIGLALVAGGFLFYNSRIKQVSEPTPTPIESGQTPSPAPTLQAEVEVSSLKVQILNGTGVPGRAGEIKELLEKEGFKDTDTGNAKKYDYTDTEVRIKTVAPEAVFEKIKDALVNYTVIKGAALEDTDTYDVIIIVGEKNE